MLYVSAMLNQAAGLGADCRETDRKHTMCHGCKQFEINVPVLGKQVERCERTGKINLPQFWTKTNGQFQESPDKKERPADMSGVRLRMARTR